MTHLSKAIDEVRAGEAKELREKGYEAVLTKTRWLLLNRPENLTDQQETRLAVLLRYNLSFDQKLPAERRVSVLLVVYLALLGGTVSG